MKSCNYCNKSYEPRKQVKEPKACPNCQKLRQKDNEKVWRENNRGKYDAKYHKKKRIKRNRKLKAICNEVIELVIIGMKFSGLSINIEILKKNFSLFFSHLQIRRVKKFWNLRDACPLSVVEGQLF